MIFPFLLRFWQKNERVAWNIITITRSSIRGHNQCSAQRWSRVRLNFLSSRLLPLESIRRLLVFAKARLD